MIRVGPETAETVGGPPDRAGAPRIAPELLPDPPAAAGGVGLELRPIAVRWEREL